MIEKQKEARMKMPMEDQEETDQRQMAAARSFCASPDPALQFVFAMFALMSWLSILVKLQPDAMMVMGFLQLSFGIAAFTGSRMNLKRMDPHGNINLILSVVLGFAGGLTQIARAFVMAGHMEASFHSWIYSVILLAGGLYMLCFLPLMNKAPAYIWFEHLFVCCGFVLMGLSDILQIPAFKMAAAWLLFTFALLALYQGISEMYVCYGRTIPQGPSMPFGKD